MENRELGGGSTHLWSDLGVLFIPHCAWYIDSGWFLIWWLLVVLGYFLSPVLYPSRLFLSSQYILLPFKLELVQLFRIQTSVWSFERGSITSQARTMTHVSCRVLFRSWLEKSQMKAPQKLYGLDCYSCSTDRRKWKWKFSHSVGSNSL